MANDATFDAERARILHLLEQAAEMRKHAWSTDVEAKARLAILRERCVHDDIVETPSREVSGGRHGDPYEEAPEERACAACGLHEVGPRFHLLTATPSRTLPYDEFESSRTLR